MTTKRATPAYVQWIITVLAVVMTIALTGIAFWLSYEHLHDVAHQHGLNGARAWAWPATLDTFIVIGEALILRASLIRTVDVWAWGLTAIGSIGSIILNITGVGTGGDPLDYTVAAVPPVAALLAFGMLMRQLHAMITKYLDEGAEAKPERRRRIFRKREPKITPGTETVPPGVLVFDDTYLMETPEPVTGAHRAAAQRLIADAFDIPAEFVSGQSRPVWDEATAAAWDDFGPELSPEPGADAMRHVPEDSDTEGHEDETTGYRGAPVPATEPVAPVPAPVPRDTETGPETATQAVPDMWEPDLVPELVPDDEEWGGTGATFERTHLDDLVASSYSGRSVPLSHETGDRPRGHRADLVIYDDMPQAAPRPTGQGITATVREMLTADFGTPDEDVYAEFGPEVDRKSVRKSINRVRKELNRP